MQTFEGKMNAAHMRFGVIVGRFNELITRNLLQGACDTLKRYGASEADISIVWVPGAFEIPLIAKQLALSGNVDAIICLGAVIRGATPHFDYVAGQCASGITAASMESGVPMAFGVLTTNTLEQAIERAGSKVGNKGSEAAICAIEMADLLRQLDNTKPNESCCSKAFAVK